MSDLQAEVAADPERFLVAYVSQDGKVIGIEHDTDADWNEVQRAHEVLRDRLNVRLAERENCPFKPAADRLEALSRPPAGELAGELMERFYLSADYDPKAERPADTVKAAIGFALRHTGPT